MVIDELLNYYRERFPRHGSFEWKPDQKLQQRTNEERVPDLPGIYLVFGRHGSTRELFQIARVGTLRKDGRLRGPGLSRRLNGRQGNRPMQNFFELQAAINVLEALAIHWFVSFDEQIKVLPAKAQIDLLQAHFDETGRLPPWNDEL